MRIPTVVALLVAVGCGKVDAPIITRYERIERVFVQGTSAYLIYFRDNQNAIHWANVGGDTVILDDVPVGESMWARSSHLHSCNGDKDSLELHIHSIKDLQGGHWYHGKFGDGQLEALE